jgi:hypothetical protein
MPSHSKVYYKKNLQTSKTDKTFALLTATITFL